MAASVLVAGAYGALGRHVVRQLRQRSYRVAGIGHGTAQWPADAPPIDHWVAGEINQRSLDEIGAACGDFIALINVAGGGAVRPSLLDPVADFRKTVLATVDMADWVRTRSPRTVMVVASSAAVYGDSYNEQISEDCPAAPVSPYGFHKLMMEGVMASYAVNFGVASAVVRLFSVYGPGLRKQLVFDVCSRLALGPESIMLSGTGAERRDWLWIEDAARLLVDAISHADVAPLIVNGCTGVGTSVAVLTHELAKLFGERTKIEFDAVARTGDPMHLVGATERLSQLGFRAQVGLTEGLSSVAAQWHRP
jgi:UDP-glucose 4-epimerase